MKAREMIARLTEMEKQLKLTGETLNFLLTNDRKFKSQEYFMLLMNTEVINIDKWIDNLMTQKTLSAKQITSDPVSVSFVFYGYNLTLDHKPGKTSFTLHVTDTPGQKRRYVVIASPNLFKKDYNKWVPNMDGLEPYEEVPFNFIDKIITDPSIIPGTIHMSESFMDAFWPIESYWSDGFFGDSSSERRIPNFLAPTSFNDLYLHRCIRLGHDIERVRPIHESTPECYILANPNEYEGWMGFEFFKVDERIYGQTIGG
jgi:hypothetical protein